MATLNYYTYLDLQRSVNAGSLDINVITYLPYITKDTSGSYIEEEMIRTGNKILNGHLVAVLGDSRSNSEELSEIAEFKVNALNPNSVAKKCKQLLDLNPTSWKFKLLRAWNAAKILSSEYYLRSGGNGVIDLDFGITNTSSDKIFHLVMDVEYSGKGEIKFQEDYFLHPGRSLDSIDVRNLSKFPMTINPKEVQATIRIIT